MTSITAITSQIMAQKLLRASAEESQAKSGGNHIESSKSSSPQNTPLKPVSDMIGTLINTTA